MSGIAAGVAVSGLLVGALPALSSSAAAAAPSPGSAGLGDRLYPTLGNGGYDAVHYDLDLRYATSKPSQPIDGTVTMTAVATKALSRFDLDFSGKSLESVTVDGAQAAFTRVGEDIVITPGKPIADGATFRVTVSHFKALPTKPTGDFLSAAFFITPDGSATAGQPNAMHAVYPSNDHPRDKASFTTIFDVPNDVIAVGNGVLGAKKTTGGRTSWTYEQVQPMATELTQLVVGKFTVIQRARASGVPVRDVVPTRLLADYQNKLGVERSQISWMQTKVGAYPFATYGSLVVDAPLGFALETQTLSLYDTGWFTYPVGVWRPVMTHELAHQWFGDSVAPYEWSDVWQNEGHATWYEWTYADEHGYLADDTGFDDFTDLMQRVYELGDNYRAVLGPVARPLSGDVNDLFSPQVYYGGALVLYALRQQVGYSTFAKIERAWVSEYKGKSPSTKDFIALASRISGQDLNAFLTAWLYGTTTPPMPGHPDWVVEPAASADALAKAADMKVAFDATRRR